MGLKISVPSSDDSLFVSSESEEARLRRENEHLKKKLQQSREKIESLNEKLEKAWDDKVALRQNVNNILFIAKLMKCVLSILKFY